MSSCIICNYVTLGGHLTVWLSQPLLACGFPFVRVPNSRHLSWAGLDKGRERQKERRLSETSLPACSPLAALPSRPTALPAIGPLCEALYTLWVYVSVVAAAHFGIK